MFPPTGSGVVTAKPRVTGTEARLATRSLGEMDIETNVTRVKMAPDETAALGKVSVVVCKYTPTLPGLAPPIVKPDMVRITAAPAVTLTPPVVMTNDVAVVALEAKVRPEMLLSLVPIDGVETEKNAIGYVIVMVLPAARGEVGENPTVILTSLLPAIRSVDAMVKNTFFTCPNTDPDGNGSDGTASAELSI